MLVKYRNIAYLLFLVFSVSGCSYTKDLTILSKKQAISDLDYLVKNVKAIHPEPHHHISEEEFDAHIEQIKANLDDKISRKDFSFLTAELLALIGDDHTKLFSTKTEKKVVEYSFRFYFADQVCLLKAPSFWYTLAEKWEQTLDKLFSEMQEKKTCVLIVDLRGNGGGNGSLGQLLIRRTAKKTFKTGSKKWRYSKAYQKACLIYGLKQRDIPAWLHLENVLKLHDFSPFKEMNLDMSKLEDEWFIPAENNLKKPWRNVWGGTLVLICDRFTSSAAVCTAVIVKDNKLGLIVGEETGGRASYFAEVAPLYLPNSGLLCKIASAHHIRPAGYDNGRGVLPDLQLDVTLENSVLIEKIYNYIQKN